MSDDIVNRLKNNKICLGHGDYDVDPLSLEAANEIEKLRDVLRPFAERINLLDECKNAAKYAVSTDINVEHLRRARDAYNNTK